MSIKEISPADVYRLYQESAGITLIDVREGDEYAEMHSPLSESYPLSAFNAEGLASRYDRRQATYVICRSGVRSLRAAKLLADAGFLNVYNVTGGMLAWKASGLPVCEMA